MNPKYSVIIPVYNVAPYLSECLKSVLAEKSEEECAIELVCVDDGSTDGSAAILDEYAAKDNRVKVIHQSNQGVSAARNAGIAAATGEWLYFLDGDDVLISGWLDKLKMLVADNRYDAYFLGRPLYFSTTPPAGVCGSGRVVMTIDSPSDGKRLLMTESLWGWPCIRLLRRSVFFDMRFPLGIGNLEDSISLIDVLAHRARWCWVDWQVYGYRSRPSSACHRMSIDKAERVISAFTIMYQEAKNKLRCSAREANRVLHQYRRHLGVYVVSAIRDAEIEQIRRVAVAYRDHEKATGYHTAYWPVRMLLWLSRRSDSRFGYGVLFRLHDMVNRIANGFERRLGIDVDLRPWYWRLIRKLVRG